MDYQKIYWDIINRAIDSKVEGYTEKHHAYPACLCRYSKRYGEREEYLFDRDADDLIVELTAREHYVAHQLLAKMYPTEPGLQLAVHMMTISGDTHARNNRSYEWVRRRHAKAMSESQSGKSNSQYGRRFKWMYHPEDRRTARVPIDQVDKFVRAGYEFGLKPKCETWNGKRSKYSVHERNAIREQRALTLFIEFYESQYDSISSFSKVHGTTHQSVCNAFKRYVPGYSELNIKRCKRIKELISPIYKKIKDPCAELVRQRTVTP